MEKWAYDLIFCNDVWYNIISLSSVMDPFPHSLFSGFQRTQFQVPVLRPDYQLWSTIRATSKTLRNLVDSRKEWKNLEQNAVKWIVKFCLENGMHASAVYLARMTGFCIPQPLELRGKERITSNLKFPWKYLLSYILSLRGEAIEYLWKCCFKEVCLVKVEGEDLYWNFALTCSNELLFDTKSHRWKEDNLITRIPPYLYAHPFFDYQIPPLLEGKNVLRNWFSIPGRRFEPVPLVTLSDDSFDELLSALKATKIDFTMFFRFVGEYWTKKRISRVTSEINLTEHECKDVLLNLNRDEHISHFVGFLWKTVQNTPCDSRLRSEMAFLMDVQAKKPFSETFLASDFAQSYFTPRELLGYAALGYYSIEKGLEMIEEREMWDFISDTEKISQDLLVWVLKKFDPSNNEQIQLYLAIKRNDYNLVTLMLKDPQIDVSAYDQRALREAVKYERMAIVCLLLEHRSVDLNVCPDLLLICINLNDIVSLRALLQDRRIDASEGDQRALKEAVKRFKWDFVGALLDIQSVDPNACPDLPCLCVRFDQIDLLRRLSLNTSIDPSAFQMALEEAVDENKKEMVDLLLTNSKVIVNNNIRKKMINHALVQSKMSMLSKEEQLEEALMEGNQIMAQILMDELGMNKGDPEPLDLHEEGISLHVKLDRALREGNDELVDQIMEEIELQNYLNT